MRVHVRKAGALDARTIAELLNEINGTSVFANSISSLDVAEWMRGGKTAWHVAEDDKGQILGAQWIMPNPDMPKTSTDIATFVRVGQEGLGVGSALFQATKVAAQALGYHAIDAIIRTNNAGGLAYYQSRGFETISTTTSITMESNQIVDKIWKRYNLRV